MPATRLFVSHSSQDNDWCRPFVAALTSADPSLDVWYDEHGLSGGSAWVQTLQQELQARDVVMLILTPDSLASQWVQEEMQLALATRRTILPVMHKPSNLTGFLLTQMGSSLLCRQRCPCAPCEDALVGCLHDGREPSNRQRPTAARASVRTTPDRLHGAAGADGPAAVGHPGLERRPEPTRRPIGSHEPGALS